jgi:DMSO reductase anchor subunit
MNPAFSVIFLTTLLGLSQGQFLAIFLVEISARIDPVIAITSSRFYVTGGIVSLVFAGLGLIASFFHLGHPERAWRSAAMWRTSWLSREVIALPAFMALVFAYALAHYAGYDATWIGMLAAVMCIVLFVCTGMIYASIRFLQEWASPLTVINYVILGLASGSLLAAAHATLTAPALVNVLAIAAALFTLLGLLTRGASLLRNARLRPRSTLATAIGVRHPHIQQKAQGFMGGSYNTREFFHGRTTGALRSVKWGFLLGAFAIPLALLAIHAFTGNSGWLWTALIVQYVGLMAERWFFFAEANHPQNLYYQAIM